MARRSLRTKLTVAVIVAVLPALAPSAWRAVDRQRAADLRKSEAVAATAELAAARYRTLIEAPRRLLEAVWAEDAVRQSANPDASPTEINPSEAYLPNGLGKFPREYSSALVTDAEGVARCATQPTALGVGFTDREVFRLVRDAKAFTIGAQVASRVAPRSVIPVALPILQDGAFRGMCAVGISLTTIGDLVTPVRAAEHVAVALVDRNGGSVGGDPLGTRAPPGTPRGGGGGHGRRPGGVQRLRPGRLALRIPPSAARQQLDLRRERGGRGRRLAGAGRQLGRGRRGRAGARRGAAC